MASTEDFAQESVILLTLILGVLILVARKLTVIGALLSKQLEAEAKLYERLRCFYDDWLHYNHRNK